MKKFIYFLLCAVLLSGTSTISATSSEQTKKTRKERNAEFRKEIDTKASKSARNRAKELIRAGWKPIGSGKPIEAQLDRAWQYEELNENDEREYIVEKGTAIANTLDAAQASAKHQARLAIAKSLETKLAGMTESEINNKALSDEDVSTNSNMDGVNIELVNQKLRKAIVISEWYRKTENGKYQVEVSLAIRITTLKEEAKQNWLNDIKSKNEELYNKLTEKLESEKSK